MPVLEKASGFESRRALVVALTLGVVNGLLLGIGLTASDRSLGLLLAFGPGTLLTLSYICTAFWKQAL